MTIYANATILGGDTVIGRGAVIGGNCWITEQRARRRAPHGLRFAEGARLAGGGVAERAGLVRGGVLEADQRELADAAEIASRRRS